MKRSWIGFSILFFFFGLSFPSAGFSSEALDFLVKFGVMEPATLKKDRLRETRIVTMDPSSRPGWCFLVDPPNDKPYEIYSIHYLPGEPTRLTGSFNGVPPGKAVAGIKTPVRLVEGIRPFCFDFHRGDPLGDYRVEVFINGVLTNNLSFEVVALERQTESDFIIESKFRMTFAPPKPLNVGQKISFELITDSEAPNNRETFFAQKCGPKCNAAKLIVGWAVKDLEKGKRIEFTIKEKGEYYFWLKKINNTGETGPVRILRIENKDPQHVVVFESGTKIKIRNEPANK